jgi:cytochrome c peroxidase
MTRLLSRPYLAAFRAIYGPVSASSNPDQVLTNIADAIASFERTEKSFALFNSKYDAVQAGLATFTPQEARGQALFFNRDKGACGGCHDSRGGAAVNPGPQLFSDQSYRVLAVPRNWAIPYNDDTKAVAALAAIGQSNLLNGSGLGSPAHAYYDLGFCGPFRTDFSSSTGLCGAFRVPTLRTVAMKSSYEHNGVFGSLAQVLDFYVNRDITPQRFYRKADGSVDAAYNDLPLIYQGNREVRPPFTRVPSGPRLSAGDTQDLIAFLCTLTDGFDPQQAQAYARPAQCRAAVRP